MTCTTAVVSRTARLAETARIPARERTSRACEWPRLTSARASQAEAWHASRGSLIVVSLRDHPVQPRMPDEVQALRICDDRRVLPVGPGPQLAAARRVDRVRPALQRCEVDDAVEDGRRAGDRAAGLELPALVPRSSVEGVEATTVGADEDELAPHRRRPVDVAA